MTQGGKKFRERKLKAWSWPLAGKKKADDYDFTPEQVWQPPLDQKNLQAMVQKVARRKPGALTLFLQNKAFERLGYGRASNLGEVNRGHIGTYLATRSPVKHAREVAEASTLGEIFDHLRQGRISQASDVTACRLIILEVTASSKGDFSAAKDWECKTPSYTTLAG